MICSRTRTRTRRIFAGSAPVAILLAAFGAMAQTTNTLSGLEIQGRQLAQKLLDQRPATSSAFTGVLNIRDARGSHTDIPVKCEAIVNPTEKHYIGIPTNWYSAYQAFPTNSPVEELTIAHSNDSPNKYFYYAGEDITSWPEVEFGHMLLPKDVNEPFANSDFWIADLGLEFLHWPGQKILRGDTARGRLCKVLESTNPNPSPNGYSRVLCWIDNEALGIVEAKAYDAQGKLLKEFYPKDIKKVDGQWQVGSMEIDNVQTGSRTRLEFDLNAK
jgi:hypothetical protein